MQLYCPKCKLSMRPAERCPHCFERLITPTELSQFGSLRASSLMSISRVHESGQETTSLLGRLLVASLAGLGVYLGLRETTLGCFTLFVDREQISEGLLYGVELLIRLAAFVVAGLLCGAGRSQPGLIGLAAGGACAGAFYLIDFLNRARITQIDLIVLAVLMASSFPAGLVGGRLWPVPLPLPILTKASRGSSLVRSKVITTVTKPTTATNWLGIGMGTVIYLVLLVSADSLRILVKNYFGHLLYMGSPAQAPMIDAMFLLLGTAMAGILASAGTGAGWKHGAWFGLGSALLTLVLMLTKPSWVEMPLEGLLSIVGAVDATFSASGILTIISTVFVYSLITGVFGSLLLPRIGRKKKLRRYND